MYASYGGAVGKVSKRTHVSNDHEFACNAAGAPIDTNPVDPLKSIAEPTPPGPGTPNVTPPTIEPSIPFGPASCAVDPDVSSNGQYATGPSAKTSLDTAAEACGASTANTMVDASIAAASQTMMPTR